MRSSTPRGEAIATQHAHGSFAFDRSQSWMSEALPASVRAWWPLGGLSRLCIVERAEAVVPFPLVPTATS